MATATSSFSESNQSDRRHVWRWLGGISLAVFVLFVVVGVAGYFWFRSAQRAAMPILDGTIAIEGLTGPVNVIRDQQGVPHITAANMEDLFVAQGYVTAQDRLWQMDMTRRYAAGDLAAALGARAVDVDRGQRLLGFRQLAQQAALGLSERDRKYFEAYARGVNTFIAEHQHALPLEFRVLRYAPRAWTPEDSLLIGASLGELLTHGEYAAELKREAVTAKIGPELAAELYVNESYRDLPPALQANPEEIPLPSKEDVANEDETLLLPSADREYVETLLNRSALSSVDTPVAPGSNNWVISGEHTVTGKPLLSNDMHLPIQIPNTWYEAQLTSNDFDVAGVTLPGVPAVIVGHNRRIAWGFTNIMADVEDVYVETFNAHGQYLTPTGWKQPEVRHERIAVKDGSEVDMDVIVTRHGPVMSEVVKGESRRVAMASTMLRPEAMHFPFFDVNAAQDWQTFKKFIVQLEVPENAVYADMDGHIGYQATGLFPKRVGWDGALPVNGSDDLHEWSGTVPHEELPSVYDPPSGILATANSRVTMDGYTNVLSNEWVAPTRVERIYRTLRQNKRFTKADMLALQTDVYSQFDQFVGERLVYAIDHSRKATSRAKVAADLLRKWDGRMEKDSAAAAIERTTRIRLRRMILESKLGKDFKMYTWFMDPVWLENVLTKQPQRWLPSGYANWNDALTDALQIALDDQKAPQDLSTWKYGSVFPVHIQHAMFGQLGLDSISGPGKLPQSGDGETVKQVGLAFGPSERFTADLSDLDASTLNIVVGQSGNLGSNHYMDQWNAWYNGTTFTMAFEPESVAKVKEHELKLVPK